ncbi:hypothetical protein [Pseudozobellia sp. WGM2]|uniref:hypothetical protein n=1 Tax=Pseudozobellia sp. WGM2 TaxID=2787625 RepID=UPI001ADFF49D|nr:hypothetical protein [Pseudozobellia sp. WGM2]
MKKVASIFAVVVMAIGMFSCEAETNLEETEAVYKLNVDAATDGDDVRQDDREDG